MSLYTYKSSFFSIQPRVREEGDALVATTPWTLRLLSLFSYKREVVVDPRYQNIRVDTKWFWGLLHRERIIRAKDVHYVDYRHSSIPTGWSMFYGRTDEVESYGVILVMNDKSEFTVARFRGQGSIHTGWSGVMLGGDSMIDTAGTQEETSRAFVDDLCSRMQLPLGAPLPGMGGRLRISQAGGVSGAAAAAEAQAASGPPWTCPACARPNKASRDSCMYCGASVQPIVDVGPGPTPQRIQEQPASASDAVTRWNQKK